MTATHFIFQSIKYTALSIVLALTVLIGNCSYQNSQGICDLTGKSLTNKERITLALEYILKEKRDPRTVAQYLHQQPDCCQITDIAEEGLRQSPIDVYAGAGCGYIEVRYSPIESNATTITEYRMVTNCGHVKR